MNDNKQKRKSIPIRDDKPNNKDEEPISSIFKIKIENSIKVITKNNTKVVINSIQDGNKLKNEKCDLLDRVDAFGNKISKGKGKRQKVSFKDFLTKQRLVEIVDVEKIVYLDDEPKTKENDNVSCTCCIF